MDTNRHFKYLLILSYLQEHQKISFIELAKVLGMAMSQVDNLISELFKKNYIEYSETNIIKLTDIGLLLLKTSEFGHFTFKKTSITSDKFKKEPLGLHEIYLPKRFKFKV